MASPRPLVLLTNDDGYGAAGLEALIAAFEPIADVWVVAPTSEQSGVSSSLSLHDPVRVHAHAAQRLAVTGTPADCVYMALFELLPRRPDLCVSGVNQGANLGDDVLYSGTVAAAIEATLADVPSLAVSHAAWGRRHDFGPAARVAARVAPQLLERGLPRGVLLNLNVPEGADGTEPIRVAKLGRRNYARAVTEKRDPRNRPYYWIGGSSIASDDIPGSDCNVIADRHISLTPLTLDMTAYRVMSELATWEL